MPSGGPAIQATRPGPAGTAATPPDGWHSYDWRSCCCTEDQRAGLAAHDDYIASLHEEPDPHRSEAWMAENPTDRQLTWNSHRARGLTVAQAALRMALGKGTARRYERIRNRMTDQQEEAAAQ